MSDDGAVVELDLLRRDPNHKKPSLSLQARISTDPLHNMLGGVRAMTFILCKDGTPLLIHGVDSESDIVKRTTERMGGAEAMKKDSWVLLNLNKRVHIRSFF